MIDVFSPKAVDYARYRWNYAPAALDLIRKKSRVSKESCVADVGSGPGVLSSFFVEKVNSVYAVEPSREMRNVATGMLGCRRGFFSVDGLAHFTGLPTSTVDLIVVGSAIQWFEPQASRAEFRRISKPGGWLAIVRNCSKESDLSRAEQSLRCAEYGWNTALGYRALTGRPGARPVGYYFAREPFSCDRFPMVVCETWEAFIGRLSSYSGAPSRSCHVFGKLEEAAQDIFDRFSIEKHLTVEYFTTVYLGRLKNF